MDSKVVTTNSHPAAVDTRGHSHPRGTHLHLGDTSPQATRVVAQEGTKVVVIVVGTRVKVDTAVVVVAAAAAVAIKVVTKEILVVVVTIVILAAAERVEDIEVVEEAAALIEVDTVVLVTVEVGDVMEEMERPLSRRIPFLSRTCPHTLEKMRSKSSSAPLVLSKLIRNSTNPKYGSTKHLQEIPRVKAL